MQGTLKSSSEDLTQQAQSLLAGMSTGPLNDPDAGMQEMLDLLVVLEEQLLDIEEAATRCVCMLCSRWGVCV